MPPRRFYLYYLTLSLGCIGAFCLWGHPPHRIAARKARGPRTPCAAFVIDARRLPPAAVQTSLFLSNSCGTVLYARADRAFSTQTPRVRRIHHLADALLLPDAPDLTNPVIVHPVSWSKMGGYLLGAPEASLIADLQENNQLGGDEQILVLTN